LEVLFYYSSKMSHKIHFYHGIIPLGNLLEDPREFNKYTIRDNRCINAHALGGMDYNHEFTVLEVISHTPRHVSRNPPRNMRGKYVHNELLYGFNWHPSHIHDVMKGLISVFNAANTPVLLTAAHCEEDSKDSNVSHLIGFPKEEYLNIDNLVMAFYRTAMKGLVPEVKEVLKSQLV
tara:strand:+ start:1427 stop:1957 length:531 start_codon:yes stop_codon:yes gene_type:complete